MSEFFEVDINNDGIEDTVVVEETSDGVMLMADTNADGLVDVAALDVDSDGAFDVVAVDTNYDGVADESYAADGNGGYTAV